MKSILVRGNLITLDSPKVMGILNVTDDSFFSGCRAMTPGDIVERIRRIRYEGADFIDIGGCSTRPGSEPVDEATEWERLEPAIALIREQWPEAIISVDTFRADVARLAVEAGADIINDVSGGSDPNMFDTVARLNVPYILTHNSPCLGDSAAEQLASVITSLAFSIRNLRERGVCDIIVDPGFGFMKDVVMNYRLMEGLQELSNIGLPLLVGISRKSMIWRPLDITPADALPGTIALNTLALQKGADILRVHDVDAARQTIQVFSMAKSANLNF